MSAVPTDAPVVAAELTRFAVAAVAEVEKFIPAGADAIPVEQFWSEAGRRVYDRQPGRFRRDRLEVVRASYQDRLSRP